MYRRGADTATITFALKVIAGVIALLFALYLLNTFTDMGVSGIGLLSNLIPGL